MPASGNDRPIGLDFISGLGMPPDRFVGLAARLGCSSVSLAPFPLTPNPCGFADWSFAGEPAHEKAARDALQAHGIALGTVEGCFVTPRAEAADYAALLDMFGAMDARRLNIVILEPDHARAMEEAARLAEMASERAMRPVLEFIPGTPVSDLVTALDAIAEIGSECSLVIDAMHLYRSGASAADVRSLDPSIIAQVQLCDVPLANEAMPYGQEAGTERLPPGAGELPLASLIDAIPASTPVSLELPMMSRATSPQALEAALADAVERTRALLR